MSKKTYTLELTAGELESLRNGLPRPQELKSKLNELTEQARADRAQEDLRLPWRAEQWPSGRWYAVDNGMHTAEMPIGICTERAAKLMSAAPELLEAVQAAQKLSMSWICGPTKFSWDEDVRPLVERALRKVETGVPE